MSPVMVPSPQAKYLALVLYEKLGKVVKYLEIYGDLMSYGLAFYLVYVFMAAFYDPMKIACMDINSYGEAWWEVWFISFTVFCMFLALVGMVRRWVFLYRKRRAQ